MGLRYSFQVSGQEVEGLHAFDPAVLGVFVLSPVNYVRVQGGKEYLPGILFA
jgi:hypothetical protein